MSFPWIETFLPPESMIYAKNQEIILKDDDKLESQA
jgi:hypothetical protein